MHFFVAPATRCMESCTVPCCKPWKLVSFLLDFFSIISFVRFFTRKTASTIKVKALLVMSHGTFNLLAAWLFLSVFSRKEIFLPTAVLCLKLRSLLLLLSNPDFYQLWIAVFVSSFSNNNPLVCRNAISLGLIGFCQVSRLSVVDKEKSNSGFL